MARGAQQPVWSSASESGALSQPGWFPYNVSYFGNIEAWYQFSGSANHGDTTDVTLSLNAIVAPGTYNFWIAMIALGATNAMAGITSIGDTSIANVLGNGVAPTNMGVFTSSIPFSNLTMRITKLVAAGTAQNYWLSAVGVMPVTYGPVETSDSFFVDYTAITQTNTDFKAGNLIPNGDFEFDLNLGWSAARRSDEVYADLGTTNSTWLSQGIDTSTFTHGAKSIKINEQYNSYVLYSPPITVRGGKVGNYTLSLDAKSSGPNMSVEFGAVYTGGSGYYTNQIMGSSGIITNGPITWTFTPTGSWARYSTNFYFTPLPTRLFYVNLYSGSALGPNAVWIDQVQLVEGVSTNYLTNNLLSMSLTANRNGNMFNTNEPRTLTAQFYNNSGSSAAVTWHYEVYDWMNHLLVSSVNSATIPTGASSTNFTLTTTNNGTTRVLAWLEESADFRDELVFTVAPLPVIPVLQTNSIFGVHGNYQTLAAKSNKAFGISWNRSLSPGLIARWPSIEAVSNVFTWTNFDRTIDAVTNNQIVFLSISSGLNDAIPAWAFTNGYPQLNAYSNYIWQVVNRATSKGVRYFETQNEPNAGGFMTPAAYAPMLATEVTAVKAAAPNAHFTAFALGNIDGAFITNSWNLLSAGEKAGVDAISIHLYPQTSIDANASDEESEVRDDLAMTWGTFTGKPVWQTESGYWNVGVRKTDVIGGKPFAFAAYSSDNEAVYRQGTTLAPEVAMRTLIRCLGVGMARYFYYDIRQADLSTRVVTTAGAQQPTLYHVGYDAFNAVGASFLWAKRFLDTPTNGVFNLTNGTVRGFLFARADESVLATYSVTKTNTDMTLTNKNFDRFDMQGNPLPTNSFTVRVGRFPTYWRTTTLTTNQMIAIFNSASLASGSDTTIPAVSVDISPVGNVNERMLPLRARWTAIDDFSYNTKDGNTNVVTSYRFLGLTDWSEWSANRIATLDTIPPIATRLEVQARDRAGNVSDITYGPTFGSGTLALPAVLRGSPLNIGRAKLRVLSR